MSRLAVMWTGAGVALEAIWASKLRALLTILGVAVGVTVVMAFSALITGVSNAVIEGFEAAGPDNLVLMAFDPTSVELTGRGLSVRRIHDEMEPWYTDRIATLPGVEAALYTMRNNLAVNVDGREVSGIIALAYSAGWTSYTPGDFIAGRDFTPTEVQRGRPVAVITSALATELYGRLDPIGRRFGASVPFEGAPSQLTVIGVFEPMENIFSVAIPYFVVLPYSVARERLDFSDFEAQIFIIPDGSTTVDATTDRVIGAMRGLRGLGPRDENDFYVIQSAQVLEVMERVTGVFLLVTLALTSAGLMVGGVGVIGIMLISVTERTREIGIRKAVGATRGAILWQFLIEASLLTVAGAALGMAVGSGMAELVERLTPVPAFIPAWAIGVALLMAAGTGMLFGTAPAVRAARLQPVDALRHE